MKLVFFPQTFKPYAKPHFKEFEQKQVFTAPMLMTFLNVRVINLHRDREILNMDKKLIPVVLKKN